MSRESLAARHRATEQSRGQEEIAQERGERGRTRASRGEAEDRAEDRGRDRYRRGGRSRRAERQGRERSRESRWGRTEHGIKSKEQYTAKGRREEEQRADSNRAAGLHDS